MTEDKDLLVNENGEFQPSIEVSIVSDEKANGLNKDEITGKINEMIRFMMETSLYDMDDSKIDEITDMALYLVKCYNKGYRHSYYNISAEIYSCWNRDETQLDNLAINIDILHNIIENSPVNGERERKGFNKFYDHIMLEVVRLADHQRNINAINNVLEDFKKNSEEALKQQEISLLQVAAESENRFREANAVIEDVSNDASQKVKKLKKKVKDVYSQFVSILGIFSAIVIVFFGGVTVFTSMLTNIHQAEWQQIGIGASAVGLVLFDTIFMFLYILSKFHDMPISVKEKSDKKWTICKWADKYPYVFLFNIFCIVVFIICA